MNEFAQQFAMIAKAISENKLDLSTLSQGSSNDKDYVNPLAYFMLQKAKENGRAPYLDLEEIKTAGKVPITKAVNRDALEEIINYETNKVITPLERDKFIDTIVDKSQFLGLATYYSGSTGSLLEKLPAIHLGSDYLRGEEDSSTPAPENASGAAITSQYMSFHEIKRWEDIKLKTILQNRHRRDFAQKFIQEPMRKAIANGVTKVCVTGRSTNFKTTGDMRDIAVGWEYILLNANGNVINPMNTTDVTKYGKFGHYYTPNRIKIDASAYAANPGVEILKYLDALIDIMPQEIKDEHGGERNLVFVMSETDKTHYRRAKSDQIALAADSSTYVGVNNTYRDRIKSTGETPLHEGYVVTSAKFKESVVNGGNIYFGDLKELYWGFTYGGSSTPASSPIISVLNPRSDANKDVVLENTFWGMMGVQVNYRKAFAIAAASLKCEPVKMVQAVVDGTEVYSDITHNKGDLFTSSDTGQSSVTSVVPYCDNINAKIVLVTNGDTGSPTLSGAKAVLTANAVPAEDDGTSSAYKVEYVKAGETIGIPSGEFAVFRAYQVDTAGNLTLTASDITNIVVS